MLDDDDDHDEQKTSEAWCWVGCCCAHLALYRHVEQQRYDVDDVGEDPSEWLLLWLRLKELS